MKTFLKKNVELKEYQMYKYIDSLNLSFIPKLIKYDELKRELTMQKIEGMNVSDMFGELYHLVPSDITFEARTIIRVLYECKIIYPDITGYNFLIEKETNKIWLVDFEHSYFRTENSYDENEYFVNQFMRGKKSWNPFFA
jgi:tRNA A-37 threonylcarbamoyl transferase component Bud32